MNENGKFDYDEEILEKAALDVYEYALKLEKKGSIQGTAYCKEGYSVSFFLKDGTTTVYLPPIEDYYSGGEDFGVYVIDLTTASDVNSLGYSNPGDTIVDSCEKAWKMDYDNDITISELKSCMNALDENNVRAIFWRGHGGIYVTENDETVFCFCLNEKVTEEKEEKYKEDREGKDKSDPPVIDVYDGKKRYAINYKFIEKYMCNVYGGLFITGACESGADGGKMALTILDKGFDAYVGVNDNVNQLYSSEILSQVAKNLTQKDEDGYYMDIETALNKAEKSYEESFGDKLNIPLLGAGGKFVLAQQSVFRLINPGVDGLITSKDGTVDLKQVSLVMTQIAQEGTYSAYSRIDGDALKQSSGSFRIDNMEKNAAYELDIYFGSNLIKKVPLYDVGPGIEELTIDLSVAYIDIVVNDIEGSFLLDANVKIYGECGDSGTNGLIQEAVPYKNDKGETVFRLPVTPGTYHILISADDYGDIEDEVAVSKNTTLTYVMGDIVTLYADVVRQYEEKYGTLKFCADPWNSSYYLGVFHLGLIDFDHDDVEELVIGYAVPHPNMEGISWLYMDVWSIESGTPVMKYEGATITQSDVGRHCEYTCLDGTYYLVKGFDGSGIDLQLLEMKNKVFSTAYTLKVSDMDFAPYLNGTVIPQKMFYDFYYNVRDNAEKYGGTIFIGEPPSKNDIQNSLNQARERIGVDKK